MNIREATAADANAIRQVHLQAFPTSAEAELVERLDRDGDSALSLVAEDDAIVGHLLLSRMRVEADGRSLDSLGLAPIAVLPERQRQGIGGLLIDSALRRARATGAQMVFLLGEPGYYSRFGFDAALAEPFASPYGGPLFQAVALVDLPPVSSGTADYAPAFGDLG